MNEVKRSPHEVESRRVTLKDVEETFHIARENQDADLPVAKLERWSLMLGNLGMRSATVAVALDNV